MKKKISIKKDVKDKTELMLFLLFACFTLCLSVGYAALNSDLKISGEANFRVVKDIRITDVSLYETTNLGLENYTSKYSKDTITIGSDLKQVNSTISYKVKVQNSGTVVMWIDSIEETKNNDNIEYILEGIGIKEFINPGEEKEFTLKIKYKDGITVLPGNTNIDTILKFNFIKPESTLAMGEKVESTEPFFNGKIAREKIESIEFRPTLDVVDNAVGSWDASLDRNGTVIASYIDSDKNGLYELYIGGIGKVNAPSSSNGLFYNFINVKNILFEDYFDTSNAVRMASLFAFDEKLESIDLSTFDTSKVTGIGTMFSGCKSLTSLDLSSFDTSNVERFMGVFQGCEKLVDLNISSFNTSKALYMQYMFNKCYSLKSLDLSHFDTSNVVDMSFMFQACQELTNLNISSFNTSKVADMQYMFNKCKKLQTIDVSSFDTSKVTNMRLIFSNCNALTKLDLSHFDTSNVEDMIAMFQNCYELEKLNISSFNTSRVTNMKSMFAMCYKLKSLDVSSFNTSNVTNMAAMFQQCFELTTLNVSSFDTSKVTDMQNIFYECKNILNLDLTSFNTANVANMQYMFHGCAKLTNIDLSSFDFSSVTASSNMFGNVPTNSLIYVKDDASKEFILTVRNDLSNVQIKNIQNIILK